MRTRIILRLYIAAVCAAAIAVAGRLSMPGQWDHFWLIGGLVLAGGAAGAWPVRVPNIKIQFTVTHPVVLGSLGMLGPAAAVVAAMAGVIGATLANRRKATGIRLIFNLGAQALAAGLAGWVFEATGGRSGSPFGELLFPMIVATSVLFLANTILVTLVICLDQRRPFLATWKESSLWTAVSYYTALSFASAIILLNDAVGPLGFLLGIAPVWMLVSFYRIQKAWQAEQLMRADQAERLNRELEGKVADRTRELQDTNDALTKAGKAKSEFLANVSHELRTPLNAVIGFSELLANQHVEGLSKKQREFLVAIHDGGEHLLSLINDILDLSKIESGRMPLNLEVVTVAPVFSEVISIMHGQAEKNRIRLTCRCDGEIGQVSVDPMRFREILLNLLSNAVKFTPEEGEVELHAWMEAADLIVQVADTGIGISEPDQEKVFEEFYQVDGTYSRKFQGTGLGLGLVRRMMEMHGGKISVQSAPGEGSRFTCRFPGCRVTLPKESPAPEVMEAALPSRRPAERTVLVADENRLNMKLAVNALRSKGYRVLEADSVKSLQEVVRTQQIDMVLVDLDLPGLDTPESVARVRNDPTAANMVVVALAGPGSLGREQVLAAGFDGLITTPVKINRLPLQVKRYLERKEKVA